MGRGMRLIVNADDYGVSERAVESTALVFASGAITSATAMVFCTASPNAARVAMESKMPVGLHLNLTDLFSSEDAPSESRRRQAAVAKRMIARAWTRYVWWPDLAADVDATISDQLQEFRSLFSQSPTHLDGHHHIHLATNVLLSRTLGNFSAVRLPFSTEGWSRGLAATSVRGVQREYIQRRFRTTERFYSLQQFVEHHETIWASMNWRGDQAVEVECHPESEDDHRVLGSAKWRHILERYEHHSYDTLAKATHDVS